MVIEQEQSKRATAVWETAGIFRETGSNRPLLLTDPDTFYVVQAGKVDIFAVPVAAGQPAGARRHLFRVNVGQALFGAQLSPQAGLGLLAVGAMGTRLLEV